MELWIASWIRTTAVLLFSRVEPINSTPWGGGHPVLRAAAVGTETTNVHSFARGGPGGKQKRVRYTEDYVSRRARMIPLAISARSQHFPSEAPFQYRGAFVGSGEE